MCIFKPGDLVTVSSKYISIGCVPNSPYEVLGTYDNTNPLLIEVLIEGEYDHTASFPFYEDELTHYDMTEYFFNKDLNELLTS